MAVRCSFDSDWNDLSKRFVFSNGDITKAVLLTSNEEVLIPHEVLTPGKLHISIVGQSENGEKKLTTAKAVPYITVLEAGPQDGNDTETYSPELWEQALIAIGDLTSLTTDKKNNIVSAINELNKNGSKTISGLKSTTRTASGTLIGDINGDGIIDNIDLIALQRYLDGTVTDIDTEAADLNGDGIADTADFELMQKLFETMNSGQLIARIIITYTDGTSDTIYEWVDATGKGEKGDTGEKGIQGEKGDAGKDGKDGYTPVKGVDYFTDADKMELTKAVQSIGYFDNNTIVLDNIENGTYTLKFEDWTGVIDGYDSIEMIVTDTEKEYNHFIPENCTPIDAKRLGVYDADGKKVGTIRINSNYLIRNTGELLYKYGAVSDIHLQYDTAQEDFARALTYLNETENVNFTCICGDLTSVGSNTELAAYKAAVDTYSPDTPVDAIPGNHEANRGSDLPDIIQQYTGHPLYYSFFRGDDLFIMLGVNSNTEGSLFTREQLQWLYETLEANRNRRCFIFEHVRPQDGCGNALGIYQYDIWGGTEAIVFESLLRHYHNVILFHGHSHLKLYMQKFSKIANYDNMFGCHSVHIPSLAVPRDTDGAVNPAIIDVYADSEGYVVDVYKNGIMLRGRDFVKGVFLPIATYWLDTTIKQIDAGTYVDTTETINTNVEIANYTNRIPMAVDADGTPYNGGLGWKNNVRISSNGEDIAADGFDTTGYIRFTLGNTLYFDNIDCNILTDSPGRSNRKFAIYDENFAIISNQPPYTSLQNAGVVADENGNLVSITLDKKYFNYLGDGSADHVKWGGTYYFRISATEINSDSIITINEPIPKKVVNVTGITFNSTSATVSVGSETILRPVITPTNATNKTIYWQSSDNSTATVKDGIVTGISEGTATIMAITEDGGHTATCVVDVTAALLPYTNQIPLSIDTDGSLFNGGTGYVENIRIKSDATEVSYEGIDTTGYIRFTFGDTLYFDNIDCIILSGSDNINQRKFVVYDESFNKISVQQPYTTLQNAGVVADENGNLISITLDKKYFNYLGDGSNVLVQEGGTYYFRLCASDINSESIITINKPIE